MPHYTGYSNLSHWRAVVDPRQPVNAISVVETTAAAHGLGCVKQVIMLGQAQGATVHYLRLITDVYQTIHGHVLDDQRHAHCAASAWVIAKRWLSEQGLTWREAVIAMPKGLRLLDGSASELMTYDADCGMWLHSDRIDPVLLEPCQPDGLPFVPQAVAHA